MLRAPTSTLKALTRWQGSQNFSTLRSLGSLRYYSVAAEGTQDQRARLTSELKNAMRTKNTMASTVLRSVLAEVQAADKGASGPISSSQITSIIKKGITRRTAAAEQFTSASRSDLAEKETVEATFLDTFVPAPMPTAEVDATMQKIVTESGLAGQDPKRAMGILLKNFYSQVDKSVVDSQIIKKRAQVALDATQAK